MRSAALGLALLVGGCAAILPSEPKPRPSEYFITEEPCESVITRLLTQADDPVFGRNIQTKCLDLYRGWFFFVEKETGRPYTSMGPTGRVSVYNTFHRAEQAIPDVGYLLIEREVEQWAQKGTEFQEQRWKAENPAIRIQSGSFTADDLRKFSQWTEDTLHEYATLNPPPKRPELVIVPVTEQTLRVYFSREFPASTAR